MLQTSLFLMSQQHWYTTILKTLHVHCVYTNLHKVDDTHT